MNIWGRESVWFSRPPIQAVSRSFFTVKQNPKAGYYKWHIPEISQSQGPRHHNVLHSMRSHTEHNLKAFEQVLFVFWRKSGRFSFFKERNTATEIRHGAAMKGSTEGNQSWSYRERCRAIRTGLCSAPCSSHTHTIAPKMQHEPSESSETKGSLRGSLELSLLASLYCHCSAKEFQSEAKGWLFFVNGWEGNLALALYRC